MIVYHATLKRNVRRILRRGLLTSLHRLKLPAVWFYERGGDSWAILHMLTRHAARIEDVAILSVGVPRADLVRSGKPGLWFTRSDVSPDHIRSVRAFVASELEYQREGK